MLWKCFRNSCTHCFLSHALKMQNKIDSLKPTLNQDTKAQLQLCMFLNFNRSDKSFSFLACGLSQMFRHRHTRRGPNIWYLNCTVAGKSFHLFWASQRQSQMTYDALPLIEGVLRIIWDKSQILCGITNSGWDSMSASSLRRPPTESYGGIAGNRLVYKGASDRIAKRLRSFCCRRLWQVRKPSF